VAAAFKAIALEMQRTARHRALGEAIDDLVDRHWTMRDEPHRLQ
jgi:hypothetical protein